MVTLQQHAEVFKSFFDRKDTLHDIYLWKLNNCRKLEKLKKIKIDGTIVPERDNALVIAFWTCLQLERCVFEVPA